MITDAVRRQRVERRRVKNAASEVERMGQLVRESDVPRRLAEVDRKDVRVEENRARDARAAKLRQLPGRLQRAQRSDRELQERKRADIDGVVASRRSQHPS